MKTRYCTQTGCSRQLIARRVPIYGTVWKCPRCGWQSIPHLTWSW